MKGFKNNVISFFKQLIGVDIFYFSSKFSWLMYDNFIKLGLSLLVSIIFVRLTSQETYGSYTFLISIFSILMVTTLPGMNASMYRAICQNKDGSYIKSIKEMLKWGGLGSLILIGIAIYYFYSGQTNISIILLISSLIYPFFYPFRLWVGFLQAKTKFKKYFIYNSFVQIIISSVLILSIILSKGNLLIIFISFILITSLSHKVVSIWVKKEINNSLVDKNLLKSSYKLFIPALFSQLYDHLDKIILVIYFGPKMLAIYAVAVLIANAIRSFTGMAIRIYLPKMYKSDINYLKLFIKKYIPIIILGIGAGLLCVAFLLPYLIPFLYSNEYASSVIYAQLYLLVVPFHILTGITSQVLIKLCKENSYSMSLGIAGIINLCGYFILIPLLGIIGAIISSILFYVIQTLINLFIIYKNKSTA